MAREFARATLIALSDTDKALKRTNSGDQSLRVTNSGEPSGHIMLSVSKLRVLYALPLWLAHTEDMSHAMLLAVPVEFTGDDPASKPVAHESWLPDLV